MTAPARAHERSAGRLAAGLLALAAMIATACWSMWEAFERDAEGVHRMTDEPRAVFGYFALVAAGLIGVVLWVRGARSRLALALCLAGAAGAAVLGLLLAG